MAAMRCTFSRRYKSPLVYLRSAIGDGKINDVLQWFLVSECAHDKFDKLKETMV